MHIRRVWNVREENLGEIVRKLKNHSWTLCTGFKWGGILILNDSTSEDALQEYAIVREADMVQLGSFTVSWMQGADLREQLEVMARIEGNPHPAYGAHPSLRIETSEHECELCM